MLFEVWKLFRSSDRIAHGRMLGCGCKRAERGLARDRLRVLVGGGKEHEPDWRAHTPTRGTACGRSPGTPLGSPGWLGWIGWIGWIAQSGALLRMAKLGLQGLDPDEPEQANTGTVARPRRQTAAPCKKTKRLTVHASDVRRGTYPLRQAGQGMG